MSPIGPRCLRPQGKLALACPDNIHRFISTATMQHCGRTTAGIRAHHSCQGDVVASVMIRQASRDCFGASDVSKDLGKQPPKTTSPFFLPFPVQPHGAPHGCAERRLQAVMSFKAGRVVSASLSRVPTGSLSFHLQGCPIDR